MQFIINGRRLALTLLSCAFIFYTGKAQKIPGHSKPLPLDPAVRTGKLSNGFTYFIRYNREPQKRVVMYLVNKVGSILEDDDQRGLAHFMEHMNFNGTTHFPKNELINYLQQSGVRFGADLNAYTSYDETVYQLPLPSDNPELLAGGIRIMRDWAQEATLEPAEIDKERGVILEEERLGKGAEERMQRKYWPLIMNGSRYGLRSPIGADTVLKYFKPETIRRFYQDWYRPDLQALIIVGDIDVNQMEQTVKKEFSTLKNPLHEKRRTHYTVPLTGKNQFITVTDPEMPATIIEVAMLHPLNKIISAADYRKQIIQTLFNQMLGGRYDELSRRADVPYVTCSAGITGFTGGLSNYDVSVQVKPNELENGFKAAWRETERLKRFGFTQTELVRAKASYLNDMKAAVKEKSKNSSFAYVSEYQKYFLESVAAPGLDKEYQLVKTYLPAIALSELNQLAQISITKTNRDVIIMAPEKEKGLLPNEATINNWMRSIANEQLGPYSDQISSKPLLVRLPRNGQIQTEQYDKNRNVTTLTLSNGIKVLLKPTSFKNNEILFGAYAAGGTSLYSDTDYQSAASAADIISAAGVGNYNNNELEKFLSGKQLSVSPYINERFQGINGSASIKDLETAMKLIYAYFTEPRKDEHLFKGMLSRAKAGLVNRAEDPNNVFNDTVSAVLGNYNIRRTGPSLTKMDQIDLEKAYTVYRERFANAAGFTFTFVGNIDITTVKPLIEKYLASLPVTRKQESYRNLHIHIPEGQIVKKVYRGSEPKATVLLVFSGKFDYSRQDMINLDALKESLEIRLLQRLREDESGVYTPGVSVSTSKLPDPRYSFVIKFGCAPQNVDKLIASTLDEIKKLRQDGPSQENLDKWRAEEKNSLQDALKTNAFWLDYLSSQLQNENSLDEIDHHSSMLDAVNPTGIRQIAIKYLNDENFIRLIMLPEKGTKVTPRSEK